MIMIERYSRGAFGRAKQEQQQQQQPTNIPLSNNNNNNTNTINNSTVPPIASSTSSIPTTSTTTTTTSSTSNVLSTAPPPASRISSTTMYNDTTLTTTSSNNVSLYTLKRPNKVFSYGAQELKEKEEDTFRSSGIVTYRLRQVPPTTNNTKPLWTIDILFGETYQKSHVDESTGKLKYSEKIKGFRLLKGKNHRQINPKSNDRRDMISVETSPITALREVFEETGLFEYCMLRLSNNNEANLSYFQLRNTLFKAHDDNSNNSNTNGTTNLNNEIKVLNNIQNQWIAKHLNFTSLDNLNNDTQPMHNNDNNNIENITTTMSMLNLNATNSSNNPNENNTSSSSSNVNSRSSHVNYPRIIPQSSTVWIGNTNFKPKLVMYISPYKNLFNINTLETIITNCHQDSGNNTMNPDLRKACITDTSPYLDIESFHKYLTSEINCCKWFTEPNDENWGILKGSTDHMVALHWIPLDDILQVCSAIRKYPPSTTTTSNTTTNSQLTIVYGYETNQNENVLTYKYTDRSNNTLEINIFEVDALVLADNAMFDILQNLADQCRNFNDQNR